MTISTIDLASFTSGSSGFVIPGASPGGASGYSVSGAGDLNGDGYNEVIIGSPSSRSSYVIFGKANGFKNINPVGSSSDGFIVYGEGLGCSGKSVSGVGDVNGDGYDDIIIADRCFFGNRGASYIIFGKATAFSTIDLTSFTSGSSGFIVAGYSDDHVGSSVSGAGDVNGDGYADVIIGANRADLNGRNNAGAAYVIFGKASGFDTINLFSFTSGSSGFIIQGAAADDYCGFSVSGAGDVNGDGYDDIIIGAYRASPNGKANAGASYIIFGKASQFGTIDLANFTSGSNGFIIQGATSGDYLGTSVNKAGDINNDGYDDIIISAQGADPQGRTDAGTSYVVFGRSASHWSQADFSTIDLSNFRSGSSGFIIQGAAAYDNFSPEDENYSYRSSSLYHSYSGRSVSGAGDVNGDGYDDIIVGAYGVDSNGKVDAGASYVIFGKESGFSTVDLASFTGGFVIQGAESEDLSGWSVSGAGDVNGDGYDDIIIGAVGSADRFTFTGKSYVIFGSTFEKARWFDNAANKLIFAGSIIGSVSTILGAAYGGYCFFNKEKPFCKEPGKVMWHGAKVMFSPFIKAASCLAGASEEGSAKHHSTPNLDNIAKSAATAVAVTTTTATAKASMIEDLQYNLEGFEFSSNTDFFNLENSTLIHGGSYDF